MVLAKIYDIDNEDIQKEYMSAFNEVVDLYDQLKADYEQFGFNDNSEELLVNYKNAFILFESEFEIWILVRLTFYKVLLVFQLLYLFED